MLFATLQSTTAPLPPSRSKASEAEKHGVAPRKPRAVPQTASPAAPTATFVAGDRVRHQIFGEGTVLAVRPMGGDTLYEVAFDSGEKKKLMATYAKLSAV